MHNLSDMKNMLVANLMGHEMTVFYSGVGTVTLHLSLSGVKSELFKMVTCLLARCRVMYPGVLNPEVPRVLNPEVPGILNPEVPRGTEPRGTLLWDTVLWSTVFWGSTYQ